MTKKQYHRRFLKLFALQADVNAALLKAAQEIYTKYLLNKKVLRHDFYEDVLNDLNASVKIYGDMARKD